MEVGHAISLATWLAFAASPALGAERAHRQVEIIAMAPVSSDISDDSDPPTQADLRPVHAAQAPGPDAALARFWSELTPGRPVLVPALITRIPRWMSSGVALVPDVTARDPRCGPTIYRPSRLLSAHEETRRRRFFALMSIIACEEGIPVALLDALIMRESRYDPWAVSDKRAFGLTQLMPGTARDLGVDRFVPGENLRGGARYLRAQLDRFGQYHLALAAYNAGPGNVRGGTVPRFPETRAYVRNILSTWTRLTGVWPRLTIDDFRTPGVPQATDAAVGPFAQRLAF